MTTIVIQLSDLQIRRIDAERLKLLMRRSKEQDLKISFWLVFHQLMILRDGLLSQNTPNLIANFHMMGKVRTTNYKFNSGTNML